MNQLSSVVPSSKVTSSRLSQSRNANLPIVIPAGIVTDPTPLLFTPDEVAADESPLFLAPAGIVIVLSPLCINA